MDGDSCNNANALVANLDGSQLHLIMQMKNQKSMHAKKGFNKKKEMDLPTSNYDLVANMNGNQLHLNVQLGGELQHK